MKRKINPKTLLTPCLLMMALLSFQCEEPVAKNDNDCGPPVAKEFYFKFLNPDTFADKVNSSEEFNLDSIRIFRESGEEIPLNYTKCRSANDIEYHRFTLRIWEEGDGAPPEWFLNEDTPEIDPKLQEWDLKKVFHIHFSSRKVDTLKVEYQPIPYERLWFCGYGYDWKITYNNIVIDDIEFTSNDRSPRSRICGMTLMVN